ncbi:hypothetical protein QR680_001951 [Steinernema hermaphroditum]|uniref:Uncharacterized protein n=1 Tax=Steinernema hermaphroditum TaxID=289476 RepID=A0AA39LH98_9BILA|nr:hypothetical protein QR680_001951 [Steinernema hermaphroditum]
MTTGRGSVSTCSNYSDEDKDKFDEEGTVIAWNTRKPKKKCENPLVESKTDDLDLPWLSATKQSNDSEPDADLEFDSDLSSESVHNIYLHIHEEESRNYTQITTYHGMVRIFNSHTWISLLFWSLVVITCLTLFIIYSANILYKFHRAPTLMETFMFTLDEAQFPNIIACPLLRKLAKRSSESYTFRSRFSYTVLKHNDDFCYKFESTWSIFRNTAAAKISFEQPFIGTALMGYALIFQNPQDRTRGIDYSKAVTMKPGQRLTGVVSALSTSWIPNRNTKQQWKDRLVINCMPSCNTFDYQIKHTTSKTANGLTVIDLTLNLNSRYRVQRLRIQTVDVLSAVGGGTSLFLGCSCVTLMETFVYLARSVWQTVVGKSGQCGHFAEDEYEAVSDEAVPSKITITRKTEQEEPRTPVEQAGSNALISPSPTERPLRPRTQFLTRLFSVEEESESKQDQETGLPQLIGPSNYLRRAPSILSSAPSSASTSTRIHLIDHRKNRRPSAFHTNVMSHF